MERSLIDLPLNIRTSNKAALSQRLLPANEDFFEMCRDGHFATDGGRNWKTAGISGHGSFTGDIEELLPFLMLGAYVHAGRKPPSAWEPIPLRSPET